MPRIETETTDVPEIPTDNPPKGGSGLPAQVDLSEQTIKNLTQDGVKIVKNTKGYGWEISVHEDDIGLALEKAYAANERVKKLLKVVE